LTFLKKYDRIKQKIKGWKIMRDKIYNEIIKTINKYKEEKDIFEKIKPVLESYEGKILNKRITTLLAREYPEYFYNLKKEYSTYLTVSKINRGVVFQLYLGYEAYQKKFTMKNVYDNNPWLKEFDKNINDLYKGLEVLDELLEERERIEKIKKEFDDKLEQYKIGYLIKSVYGK